MYYRYCGADGDRCPERASFEADGKLRCLQHREPGMRPRNKICQVEGGGCTRQSSFGVEGGKPVLCTVHKEPGMVQVRGGGLAHPVVGRVGLFCCVICVRSNSRVSGLSGCVLIYSTVNVNRTWPDRCEKACFCVSGGS